jgi:hypothetical protein
MALYIKPLIQDSGFLLQDARCRVKDAGYALMMQDAGYRMQVARLFCEGRRLMLL